MIIVSQDKRLITESLAISIEDIEGKEEKKIMIQEHCGKLYLLGVYATEERAKEVLQEIIKLYKATETFKAISNRISDEVGAIAIENGFVYEMPEK